MLILQTVGGQQLPRQEDPSKGCLGLGDTAGCSGKVGTRAAMSICLAGNPFDSHVA